MKKQKGAFRWWYVMIWLGALILLIYGIAGKSAYLIVTGVVALGVPVLLLILKSSKHKTETVSSVSEAVTEPLAAKEQRNIVEAEFEVENAKDPDRQAVLKKVYKILESEDSYLDAPDCILYSRGTDSSPSYVVYLGSDRIGDVPGDICPELSHLSDTAKLLGITYSIDTEGFDSDQEDLLYYCLVKCRFELPTE